MITLTKEEQKLLDSYGPYTDEEEEASAAMDIISNRKPEFTEDQIAHLKHGINNPLTLVRYILDNEGDVSPEYFKQADKNLQEIVDFLNKL